MGTYIVPNTYLSKPVYSVPRHLVLSFVSVVGILLKDVFLEKTVSRKSKGYSKAKFESKDPEITLLLRMPGRVEEHRRRFFCDFFRTTVLFWPPSYGKIVLVLDEESEMDHEFGEIIPNHIRARFPG